MFRYLRVVVPGLLLDMAGLAIGDPGAAPHRPLDVPAGQPGVCGDGAGASSDIFPGCGRVEPHARSDNARTYGDGGLKIDAWLGSSRLAMRCLRLAAAGPCAVDVNGAARQVGPAADARRRRRLSGGTHAPAARQTHRRYRMTSPSFINPFTTRSMT